MASPVLEPHFGPYHVLLWFSENPKVVIPESALIHWKTPLMSNASNTVPQDLNVAY